MYDFDPVKAVIFDFDGTLTRPGSLDFNMIRQDLDCPWDRSVLEFIEGIDDAAAKNKAFDRLYGFEMAGAAKSAPNPGAEQTVIELKGQGIRVAILTRNRLEPLKRALDNFKILKPVDFDHILTRDDPFKAKPDPAGIFEIADRLGVSPGEVVVVGDYIFDIQAGRNAGCMTVFLDNGSENSSISDLSTFTISRIDQLNRIVMGSGDSR